MDSWWTSYQLCLKSNESKEYVGLPRDTWTMKNFTVEQYDAVLGKIRNNEISINNTIDSSVETLKELAGANVTVKNANAAGSIK